MLSFYAANEYVGYLHALYTNDRKTFEKEEMQMDALHTVNAIELQAAVKNKQIGVEELTRAYLARIEQYDSKTNAIAEINENALVRAKEMDRNASNKEGLLFGLPILIKDNIDVAGLHTTAGSLVLTDNLSKTNACIVTNILQHGGIVLGKTNMTEFANFTTSGMPNGYSSKAGYVRNAYDPTKNPGGSSTGSAVAMSAGYAAMAVGTDTCFSIVHCATKNGVVGLKPSFSALPGDGIVPISHTFDSAGPLTHDLSDAILLYRAMANQPNAPITPTPVNELKLAVNMYTPEVMSEAKRRAHLELFDILRQEGAQVSELEQPDYDAQRIIMECEFKQDLEQYLSGASAHYKTLEEIVAFYKADPEKMMRYGITILETALQKNTAEVEYHTAMAYRETIRSQTIAQLAQYDACIMMGPTNIMHFTGLPSLALKLCMNDTQIPKGIILYGANEKKLLAAALTIEKYGFPVTPPKL